MLRHTIDLVFKDAIARQQAEWLWTTTVPLRSVTFEDNKYYDWDRLTARAAADVRLFAGSQGTLEVSCPASARYECSLCKLNPDSALTGFAPAPETSARADSILARTHRSCA